MYSKLLSDCVFQTSKQPSVSCHKGCVTRYNLKRTIKQLQEKNASNAADQYKKRLRLSQPHFDFRKHCIFCGEDCILEVDEKNPSRHRKTFLRATAVDKGRTRPYPICVWSTWRWIIRFGPCSSSSMPLWSLCIWRPISHRLSQCFHVPTKHWCSSR